MFKYEEYLPAQKNELHWNRYVKFILAVLKTAPKTRVRKGLYLHHIIPACFLPEEFRKDRENLIYLTARQHYIAHLILWKALGGPMAKAFALLSNEKTLTSRQYEKLIEEVSRQNSLNSKGKNNPNYGKHWSDEMRKHLSEKEKGKYISLETRAKMSESKKGKKNYNYGKPMPDEQRKKISESRTNNPRFSGKNHPMYGRTHSEETKRKSSERMQAFNAKRGRFRNMTNGVENRQVTESEVEKMIDRGWWIGITQKPRPKRIRITNGNITKTVTKEEFLNEYQPSGWVEGMTFSKPPKTASGKRIVVKEGIRKFVDLKEIDKYLSEGWELSPRSKEQKVRNPHIRNSKGAIEANKRRKGFKVVYKDGITKQIRPEQLDFYLSQGWILGCKPKKIS